MATISSVYAKALFELGNERGDLAAVAKQLREFWDGCKAHGALVAALTGPTVDARSRAAKIGRAHV